MTPDASPTARALLALELGRGGKLGELRERLTCGTEVLAHRFLIRTGPARPGLALSAACC